MYSMKAALAAALLAAVVAAAVVHGQQPAPSPGPSFRVEVNYVELDASVTDAQGKLVTTLTADDFEVLEDGRPQKVTAFSLVNLPIERAERPLFADQPIEADVQTNEQVEGRIYLIVLDDLHIDPARGLRVRTAVRRFIEQNFGTNDLAAVAYTSGRAGDTQDFTNNTRLLLRAVDRFTGRKLPSSTVEQLSSFTVGPNGVGPGVDTFKEERPFRARNVMNTIRKLAEFMSGVRGRRKALVLVSERSEEHTSELQSLAYLVCRLLLEKKNKNTTAGTDARAVDSGPQRLARRLLPTDPGHSRQRPPPNRPPGASTGTLPSRRAGCPPLS